MMLALGVVGAGAAGAICRYVVDGALQSRWRGPFPIGTLVINVSGSLVLGAIAGYVIHHASAPAGVRVVIGTGFVGAYTTFSTLAYEALQLAREGARGYAFANLLGSMAAGIAAAALGVWGGGHL
jgi:fluoride exporter